MNVQDIRTKYAYHFWAEGRTLTAARGAHPVAFATLPLAKFDTVFGRE